MSRTRGGQLFDPANHSCSDSYESRYPTAFFLPEAGYRSPQCEHLRAGLISFVIAIVIPTRLPAPSCVGARPLACYCASTSSPCRAPFLLVFGLSCAPVSPSAPLGHGAYGQFAPALA